MSCPIPIYGHANWAIPVAHGKLCHCFFGDEIVGWDKLGIFVRSHFSVLSFQMNWHFLIHSFPEVGSLCYISTDSGVICSWHFNFFVRKIYHRNCPKYSTDCRAQEYDAIFGGKEEDPHHLVQASRISLFIVYYLRYAEGKINTAFSIARSF